MAAKLRFRNLPPYFLLAMVRDPDVTKDDLKIEPLIKNLQDMRESSKKFTLSSSQSGAKSPAYGR